MVVAAAVAVAVAGAAANAAAAEAAVEAAVVVTEAVGAMVAAEPQVVVAAPGAARSGASGRSEPCWRTARRRRR